MGLVDLLWTDQGQVILVPEMFVLFYHFLESYFFKGSEILPPPGSPCGIPQASLSWLSRPSQRMRDKE